MFYHVIPCYTMLYHHSCCLSPLIVTYHHGITICSVSDDFMTMAIAPDLRAGLPGKHPWSVGVWSWRAVSQLEVSRFEPGAFRSWFFPSHVSGLGVIEIYMLALAWRWIWWAPAIVSVLISEYWAKNRGQIHDMECQKSRCHFFVFARFNYIFSVFMGGSSQIHNLECQRLDNI